MAFTEETGIPLDFLITLFQDNDSQVPDGADAIEYAEFLAEEAPDPGMFVGADFTQRLFEATPYDGSKMPGKCLLGPDMVMIECGTGHGNEDFFDRVVEHVGTR